jgi:flavin-dependent dehydrogenase
MAKNDASTSNGDLQAHDHDDGPYDVIIVGGRIAGAVTGLLLARAGHRVVVVDRVESPAGTLSTHMLFPAANVQLRRWGLLDHVIATGTPATSALVTTVDGFTVELPFPRAESGVTELYHPRRTVLDPLLRDAAAHAGVELLGGVAVDDVLRNAEGRVIGVVGRRRDGSRIELRGRFVVGADGYRSRIASLVGAPSYDELGVVNSTHYAYFVGLDQPGLEVWSSTTGLMAGAVPTNDGTCVYLNCRPDRLSAMRPDAHSGFPTLIGEVAPDLAARLADAEQATAVRGTSGIPNFKRQPWGPGWALVGDAGCTKDPVSGHGISDAMVSAELAAHALHRVLDGECEQTALSHYHDERDRLAADVYDLSLRWASYLWTADDLLTIQARYGEALTAAGQAASSLPNWPGVSTVSFAET